MLVESLCLLRKSRPWAFLVPPLEHLHPTAVVDKLRQRSGHRARAIFDVVIRGWAGFGHVAGSQVWGRLSWAS